MPAEWLSDPSKITATALLVAFIAGLLTKKIVLGWVYDAVVKERDQLRAKSDADLQAFKEEMVEERRWIAERERERRRLPAGNREGQ